MAIKHMANFPIVQKRYIIITIIRYYNENN
jgi:hypothetical protein